MALGPNYKINHDETKYKAEAAMERGGIVVSTGTSASLDPGDPGFKVNYTATVANAKVVGLLFQTAVASGTYIVPETFGFVKFVGEPVRIVTNGVVETNMIPASPTLTITNEAPAYLAANGVISPDQATNAPRVGTFKSTATNGYAAVSIELI